MEEIDITISGAFGGIGDGTPRGARLIGLDKISEMMLKGLTIEYSMYDSMECIVDAFGLNHVTITETIDPWVKYTSGQFCDCCGTHLNPLNKSRYLGLCQMCDDTGEADQRMEISTYMQNGLRLRMNNAETFEAALIDVSDIPDETFLDELLGL